MHTSCPCQNQSENSKNLKLHVQLFTYVDIYENVIFLYYRKRNRKNYPKSLFLNAFINVEISFIQIGSEYSLKLIKSDIFHSTASNSRCFDRGQGVDRITLITENCGT